MARQRTAVDPSAELYAPRCHRWMAYLEARASLFTSLAWSRWAATQYSTRVTFGWWQEGGLVNGYGRPCPEAPFGGLLPGRLLVNLSGTSCF